MSVNSDSDHDWIEDCSDTVKCLFCELSYDEVPEAIIHCAKVHHFDLSAAKQKYNMDSYSYIKCINYTRTRVHEDESFNPSTMFESDTEAWNDDKYLIPVVKDDPWLMFCKTF